MREFTLLMLAHVLGDYWFQPQSLARAKSRNLGWVLLHALIYAGCDDAYLAVQAAGSYSLLPPRRERILL